MVPAEVPVRRVLLLNVTYEPLTTIDDVYPDRPE